MTDTTIENDLTHIDNALELAYQALEEPITLWSNPCDLWVISMAGISEGRLDCFLQSAPMSEGLAQQTYEARRQTYTYLHGYTVNASGPCSTEYQVSEGRTITLRLERYTGSGATWGA